MGVQAEGTIGTLLSTAGGDIQVGDRISPSAIIGFGAKNNNSGWVVGIAQGSLNSSTKGAVKSALTDSSGAKQEVFVATVPVLIKVMYYNLDQKTTQESSKLPTKVQSIADSVAGKHASIVAVVLGFCLLFSSTVVAGMIVVTAVRKGLEGITRQPLAKQALQGRMTQSIFGALGIVVAALIGSLLLLRVL